MKHITLIRLGANTETIYESEAHIIVALSRHTVSFKYITCVPSDVVSNIVRRGISLSESELDAVYADEAEAAAIRATIPHLKQVTDGVHAKKGGDESSIGVDEGLDVDYTCGEIDTSAWARWRRGN